MANEETLAGLRQDLEYLAGDLPHRASNSDRELQAAQYIRGRLEESAPQVDLQPFSSTESFYRIFAAYYAEFVVVALVGIWLPLVAFTYGIFVFVCYMSEFTGFNVLRRFLPPADSQNVAATFPVQEPRRVFVITAHYDTGLETALTRSHALDDLRRMHLAIVVCMVVVIVANASQGFSVFNHYALPYDRIVGWCAALLLASVAGALLYCEMTGEEVRGANANASGVAVMLALAERLKRHPLEHTAVWLVATGSKEGWLNGIRHLVKTAGFPRTNAYFLNLDYLGHGQLRYAVAEGILGRHACSAPMRAAAERVAPAFGATPVHLTGLPTDAVVPLARGMHALTLTATDEHGGQPHRNSLSDSLLHIDWDVLGKAVNFSERLLRQLEHDLDDDGTHGQ